MRRSGSGKHTYATTRSARILTNGIVETGADKYRQTSVRDGTVGAGRRRSSRDNIRGASATLRRVCADEIESLAIGARVLGIGGGPYLAFLIRETMSRLPSGDQFNVTILRAGQVLELSGKAP